MAKQSSSVNELSVAISVDTDSISCTTDKPVAYRERDEGSKLPLNTGNFFTTDKPVAYRERVEGSKPQLNTRVQNPTEHRQISSQQKSQWHTGREMRVQNPN